MQHWPLCKARYTVISAWKVWSYVYCLGCAKLVAEPECRASEGYFIVHLNVCTAFIKFFICQLLYFLCLVYELLCQRG